MEQAVHSPLVRRWWGRGRRDWAGGLTAAFVAERDRWILWTPVLLGSGIAGYFAMPVEPPRWFGPLLAFVALAAAAIGRRQRPRLLLGAIVLGLFALGFTLGSERSRAVQAPVLAAPTQAVSIEGRIAEVEPLEQGQHRLLLDRLILPAEIGPLERLRIRLRDDDGDWRPGQRVVVRGVLLPPPPPAAPGAYDYARQAWFQGIGAVGYALSAPRLAANQEAGTGGEGIRLAVSNLRHDLTGRIVDAIEAGGLGRSLGWVAAALITAERGPVSPDLLQAYRDAGLAHILVIAGMHMSMVAGLVFVALRGVLAAIPYVALRFPIKKWTAFGALLVTFGYLVISGAPVPTQRAFIMNAIVLLAVLADREAVSLRSITWAALFILLWRPESLVGASFQMSFAAVYGLISAYEAIGPRLAGWRRRHRGAWRLPLFHVAGILLTTQIAGTATAFYTIFHFNRYATYGLLGNFLAVPLVGFWVMPSALLAFVLMPFSLDAWAWQLMGRGIALVGGIARWVSGLPGASIDLPAMPIPALALFTLGGFWLLLWRGRWRSWGLVGMAAGAALYASHRPPDVLIDASGRMMAARVDGGVLAFSQVRADRLTRETWARQAGQGNLMVPWWRTGDGRLSCDRGRCRYRQGRHVLVLALRADGLQGGCDGADVVVGPLPPSPSECPSAQWFVDTRSPADGGTRAFRLDGDVPRWQSVADWQGLRPWNHFLSGPVNAPAFGQTPAADD